jgi:hypothetical protein
VPFRSASSPPRYRLKVLATAGFCTLLAAGAVCSAWSDAPTRPLTPRVETRTGLVEAPSALLSPVTVTYVDPTRCAPKPLVQSRYRPRRKIRRKPRPRPKVAVAHRRRPAPTNLAEMVHPARCEVVRHSTLIPAGAYLAAPGAAPVLLAFAPVTTTFIQPPLVDGPQALAGGPAPFPGIPPIIGGGRRNSRGLADAPRPPPIISAAPEPAAWALYVAGVAMTGLSLRARRRHAPAS